MIARPDSTVELKCDALYGYNIKPGFHWVVNDTRLSLSNSTYNPSQRNGDLRIENISEEAYGVYQCVARQAGLALISGKAHVMRPCK